MGTFIEFNPEKDTFTYHSESTPKYYLNDNYFKGIYEEVYRMCETQQDIDALKYIKILEMSHRTFCLGEIDSKTRRKQIDEAKSEYIKEYSNAPSHCSIYNMFYKKVNKGRW